MKFLSMKLASVNPFFHNCGLDPEGQMDQTQVNKYILSSDVNAVKIDCSLNH